MLNRQRAVGGQLERFWSRAGLPTAPLKYTSGGGSVIAELVAVDVAVLEVTDVVRMMVLTVAEPQPASITSAAGRMRRLMGSCRQRGQADADHLQPPG